MKVRTLSFKLNALTVAALAISLVAYSGLLYFSSVRSYHRDMDQDLRKKSYDFNNMIGSYLNILGRDAKSFAFTVEDMISGTGTHPHANKIEKFKSLWERQKKMLGLSADYVNVLNVKGESVAHSGPYEPASYAPFWREAQQALKGRGGPVIHDVRMGNKHLRLLTMPISYELREPHVLQIGSSLDSVDTALAQRLVFIGLSITFILLSTSLLNLFFTSRIMRPVLEIATTAKNMDYKDLSKRIQAKYPDEEMQDLVDSFNDMLSRFERSFKYISQFSSHVSHELKTPLTIMKGEAELAMRKNQDPEEYRRVIQNNLEETERLIRIVNDMLLLTRLDYQPEVFQLKPMDLVEFFKEMQEPAQMLSTEKKVNLGFDFPSEALVIKGDRVHLRRLFFNLIHNALKFTPPNGQIDIRISRDGQNAVASVADTGSGIPPQVLPKIFDQFFHFDRPGQQSSGTGLGLSIAQSIAKIHHGRIGVQSQPGKGATFTVELPLSV